MENTKKGRICFMGNAPTVHLAKWVNFFAEREWEVHLITWHKPGNLPGIRYAPSIKIHRIFFPPHYFARYGALMEIAILMRNIHPDIIHAHYLGHFGILASLYGRLFRFRPIVLSAWGSDVLVDAKGRKRKLITKAINIADCVHCDAMHIRDPLIKLGCDPEKLRLIYFGVDTQKFSPEKRNKDLRRRWGIDGTPVVTSLRNLEPVYDVKSLIMAIPLVLKEVPAVKFLVAGKGSEEAELRKMSETLGISNNVEFIGFLPNNELPEYLASSDVYVSTSLADGGLAASTAEAMACGVPAVITDFGDNNKWVQDGVNGFLYPMQDYETLASKIIHLLLNEVERKEFGQASRKVIEERNSFEKEMGKMEQIYNELIGRYSK